MNSIAIEEPGRFFHPLLGVLITGAARLMLALAERVTLDEGLEWVFCDTDSLAIALPAGMERAEFLERVARVVEWFQPLNPYDSYQPIFKPEKVNFDAETGGDLPLYAFAISSKRYALFNIDVSGSPALRKISQHGLGHLMPPYETSPLEGGSEDAKRLKAPDWHRDLWLKIVEAALGGNPDRVSLDWHEAFDQSALSRYGANTPDMLAWFID